MNKQLVRGSALVSAPPAQTWDESLQEGFAEGFANTKLLMQQAQAEKNAINAKTAGYIDALDTNVDITELTSTQQQAITNYLVDQRSEYADAASQIARIEDPTDPQYMELRSKINGISQSFKNLATQVNSYKDDKASYLKDFDNSLISNGNEINTLNEASKLYTDQASLGVGQGGSLVFWNEGKETYDPYSKIPKPFLKDFATADAVLKINKNLYNAGASLTGARRNMVRQQLNNVLTKGGRKTLLSMAQDDFILQGGLGLTDPELFAPGNDAALKEVVLDSYMNILTDSAAQGAADKRPSSRAGSGGFSGTLKDEINVSSNVAEKAALFSDLSKNAKIDRAATSRQMASIINAIDPRSTKIFVTKEELYNNFLTGLDKENSAEAQQEFIDEFGNFDMYISNPKTGGSDAMGIPINIEDPTSMYEFYMRNSGLSDKAQNYFIGNRGKQTKKSGNSSTKNKKTNTGANSGNFG